MVKVNLKDNYGFAKKFPNKLKNKIK